jgi:DNA-directed RNA polymerase subunit RPC12/RpoP
MKIINKDGKKYLVGSAAEVGRILTKTAKKSEPIDLGWSLSKQADTASDMAGERYQCTQCSYKGSDSSFVGGGCPECGGKNMSRI